MLFSGRAGDILLKNGDPSHYRALCREQEYALYGHRREAMKLKESDLLDLPDAPDFISTPPQYTAAEMAALCERMLPYWNAQRYSKPEPEFVGEEFRWDDELLGGRK